MRRPLVRYSSPPQDLTFFKNCRHYPTLTSSNSFAQTKRAKAGTVVLSVPQRLRRLPSALHNQLGWQCVGGGGTHLLIALVISPLTTYPFRDGAPFLLLIEIPPTFGRSLYFFRILQRNGLLTLSPFPVSPFVATIY